MLTVAGKALGRKKPLFAEWSTELPPNLRESGTTLRDIIRQLVRTEVRAFKKRQDERTLLRALTARAIDAGVQKGKVEMGRSDVPVQVVDEDAAVSTALQAFEDGLYLVVIDEQEHKRLDSQVCLQPESRITFIRLTLLAGG